MRELVVLDRAVYDAVHATPSPTLDHAVARISRAADHSKLWLAIAAALALAGGRAAGRPWSGWPRWGSPPRWSTSASSRWSAGSARTGWTPVRTHVVRMPTSRPTPPGHAASAFAFSTAVGGGLPELDAVLRLAATAVAYSRVHTGVHYPGDVIAGGGDRGGDRVARAAPGASRGLARR